MDVQKTNFFAYLFVQNSGLNNKPEGKFAVEYPR
jgi:hypothetical protein